MQSLNTKFSILNYPPTKLCCCVRYLSVLSISLMKMLAALPHPIAFFVISTLPNKHQMQKAIIPDFPIRIHLVSLKKNERCDFHQ